MKKSAFLFLCYLLSLTGYSCGQSSNSNNKSLAQTIQHNGKTYTLKKNVDTTNNSKFFEIKKSNIIFHEVRDTQRNMLLGHMPLPDNWKIHNAVGQDQVVISGPDNVKIYAPQSNYFTYSELPGMNEMSAQAGHQVTPLISVENLVKTKLEPLLKNEGTRLTNQYHYTELQKYAENYDQFTFKSVPMQKEFKAYVTEWEGVNNTKLLMVINHSASYSQTGVFWGYYANMMEAPKAEFEVAKKNYLYALTHCKYNPKWLQTCYMEEAQKAKQRNELHTQRMAALRAEGQAIIQRGKAYNAIVDHNHKRFMDTHLERTTVSSLSSGQSYQVDSGNKEYWMNSSNEYIPSDDLSYDPNMDNTVNNESWTRMTIQN